MNAECAGMWDTLRTRAIPECLRKGVFTTRRYTSPRYDVYLTLPYNVLDRDKSRQQMMPYSREYSSSLCDRLRILMPIRTAFWGVLRDQACSRVPSCVAQCIDDGWQCQWLTSVSESVHPADMTKYISFLILITEKIHATFKSRSETRVPFFEERNISKNVSEARRSRPRPHRLFTLVSVENDWQTDRADVSSSDQQSPHQQRFSLLLCMRT